MRAGRYKNGDGYVMLYEENHPFSDKQGYVREHRLVMEYYLSKSLGVKIILHPRLVVHHVNKIRHDNRIDNLELMLKGNHQSIHASLYKKDMSTRKCMECDSNNGNPQWHKKSSNNFLCTKCYQKHYRETKKILDSK